MTERHFDIMTTNALRAAAVKIGSKIFGQKIVDPKNVYSGKLSKIKSLFEDNAAQG